MGTPLKIGMLLLLFSLSHIECQITTAKFSDLIGLDKKSSPQVKAEVDAEVLPEVDEPTETPRSSDKETEKDEKKSEKKPEYNAPVDKDKNNTANGIGLLFGVSEPRTEEDEQTPSDDPILFRRPTFKSLGFNIPMSFLQNFKGNVDWRNFVPNPVEDLDTNRVKRSTLDEAHFRNAMIAAILQRQLLMAEDHRIAHSHEHVEVPAQPPPPHHVSSLRVPSPLAAPDAFSLAARPAPVEVHSFPAPPPQPVALVNSVHKGYDPPIKGGSLEDIFGVSSKYYSPAKPAYSPEPTPLYVPPTPAYQPPVPAYQPPAPAYQPPPPAYQPPAPTYTPEPVYNPPETRYVTPEPVYSPPEPNYVSPEPKFVVTAEPIFHPGPKYVEPEPAYVSPPKPEYIEPVAGSYKPPSFKGHPFSMEMVFSLPMHNHFMQKYSHLLPESIHLPSPDRVYITPTPGYEPQPTPVYHEPSPAYQEPVVVEPAYVAPKKVGYDLPSHGGSLEEIFGLSTEYGKPKYIPPSTYEPVKPDYTPPAYQPNLLPVHNEYSPPHNSYTLHYLPFEDYVPHNADALAAKARVPSIPGAAHILVKSPHPHVGDIQHVTAAPLLLPSPTPSLHLPPPPPRLLLPDPHRGKRQIQKRSAQG